MNVPLNNAMIRLRQNSDFQVFLAWLLTTGYVFKPLNAHKEPDKVAIQQHMIWLQGELEIFTTLPSFPLDYVQAVNTIPRNPRGVEKKD